MIERESEASERTSEREFVMHRHVHVRYKHIYRVGFPKYQDTDNPKYQKSKATNTIMRPCIFVTRFLTRQDWIGLEDWRHISWIQRRLHSSHYAIHRRSRVRSAGDKVLEIGRVQ